MTMGRDIHAVGVARYGETMRMTGYREAVGVTGHGKAVRMTAHSSCMAMSNIVLVLWKVKRMIMIPKIMGMIGNIILIDP